ncbi:hypothetical protein F4781DRAFT_340708 [Annulohypoxylon bovei var. microspora]|nr:hypothetical protein F4781DRAFT_340708 [Annulohypoxylon bovei var. microspora]
MISRQKSCVPCARAKRRCEPQTPKCPRCARRGINCYYKNQPGRGLGQRNGSPQLHPTAKDRAYVAKAGKGEPHYDGDPLRESRAGEAGERLDDFSAQETSLLRFRQIRMPGLHPYCPFVVPVTVLNPQAVPTLTRSVMTWPGKFLRKLELPFIHSSQQDTPSLPRPLEEAFSACASYASREEVTKGIVMNIIGRKVTQLIGLDPSKLSIDAHIASLQAFLILHIIQLWDGDARQRAQAEMHSYILESWVLQLHMRTTEASKDKGAALAWDRWIKLESARRTVIMTLMTQGVYEMNRYGVCSYVPNMADLPFTTTDGPWDAENQSDWKERTERLEAAVTSYGDYAISWDESISGPQSEFGKFILLPCPSPTKRAMILSGRCINTAELEVD